MDVPSAVYSFAFTPLPSLPKFETISRKASCADAGCVARPSSVNDNHQHKRSCIMTTALTKVGEDIPFGDNVFRCEGFLHRETVTACTLPTRLSSPASKNFE
jgi:hypothetical protein